ncbi:Hypothetical protein FKW44_004537 [Caligus rogercresseyi]|uniref:Uncharacterized protein n=1 Tax=Caligus rogercresseyi TaxID=217165 RepID=A0A7T8HLP4_CALRO|nr:Hypothetical protein FKW44_004537 [Caligus rogercresseyi]
MPSSEGEEESSESVTSKHPGVFLESAAETKKESEEAIKEEEAPARTGAEEEELSSTESNSSESTGLNLRPKRAIPKKSKPPSKKKKPLPKGKGRRWIFKKTV